jgi:hypothetical protein
MHTVRERIEQGETDIRTQVELAHAVCAVMHWARWVVRSGFSSPRVLLPMLGTAVAAPCCCRYAPCVTKHAERRRRASIMARAVMLE